jgi:hypothetical protein
MASMSSSMRRSIRFWSAEVRHGSVRSSTRSEMRASLLRIDRREA